MSAVENGARGRTVVASAILMLACLASQGLVKARRSSRTFCPCADRIGGSIVRNRNGDPSRTCSNRCPNTRGSSAVM
jgi:hypothetical protein